MWLHCPMREPIITTMPADLPGRLRYLRQRAELRPEQVGLKLGITARVIGDWERGYRTPRLHLLRQLAFLYGEPVSVLIDAEVIPRSDRKAACPA